jgi:hypothetical protein
MLPYPTIVNQDRSTMNKRSMQYWTHPRGGIGKINNNNNVQNESPLHGKIMNRDDVCLFNKLK